MSDKISRILVILANPTSEYDKRANLVNEMCKTFCESCQKADIEIDLLDLYKDEEFDPVHDVDEKDTKVLEYQIRLRKSQMIIFFHPVWWLSVPAILKGFLDKVLVSGFAYKIQNRLPIGLLDEKKAIVVAVSDKPSWQIKYVYGNVLSNFWQKGVLDFCGIKNKLLVFGNFRSIKEDQISHWMLKMETLGQKINSHGSILDLF